MSNFIPIHGINNKNYELCKLSIKIVDNFFDEINNLLTSIGNSDFPIEMIRKDSYQGHVYKHKWDLSYVLLYKGRPIGIFINYLRLASSDHPLDSIYIHKIAIHKNHQRKSLAYLSLIKLAHLFFSELNWLNNITIQATIEPYNLAAVTLYEKLNFIFFSYKSYHNKKDALYILRRKEFYSVFSHSLFTSNYQSSLNKKIVHPRLTNNVGIPKLFFSTSSQEKQAQFRFLFSLYNITIEFYSPPLELIEPQIDGASPELERLLVEHPLKLSSRFVAQDEKIPFLIEDTMLFIERFNIDFLHSAELPGLDTKRWWKQFGNEGILELLNNSNKRKAKYVSQIGCYLGGSHYVVARGEINGSISNKVKTSQESYEKFPKTNPYFFHAIFIPDGIKKTYAELDTLEFIKYDYRRICVLDLINKLNKFNIPFNRQMVMEF